MARVDPDQLKLVGFRLRLAFEELAVGFRKLAEAQEEAVQQELRQMKQRRAQVAAEAKVRDTEYQQWKQLQVADRG